MKEKHINKKNPLMKSKKEKKFPVFYLMAVIMVVVVMGSVLFLIKYNPAPSEPPRQITLEQKMEHLQTGAPLPSQQVNAVVPRWLLGLILSFVVVQICPLLLASYKAKSKKISRRKLRQIEFLVETPLFLGLLGSLLGVCMTQFITGSLAAPLAYLTTISGILLYLFGRFAILVSLPSSSDLIT